MEKMKRQTTVGFPSLVLIAGTRVLLGAGLALLLVDKLSVDQRKAVGWTLFGIGVLSTIPLAMEVLRGRSFTPIIPIRSESAA